jgi:hypothetical protein
MEKLTYIESSVALENAQVMLDMCRTDYERAGHAVAVQALRGLDVTSEASAQLALSVVYGLPTPTDELSELRNCALHTVRAAFAYFRPLRLAS